LNILNSRINYDPTQRSGSTRKSVNLKVVQSMGRSSDGKKVIINATINEDTIIINFIDYGPTVPKNKRDRIFERGHQLGKGGEKGRGLGLAIVKRIADIHNGEVGVKSNKPTGNIFYLKIPK